MRQRQVVGALACIAALIAGPVRSDWDPVAGNPLCIEPGLQADLRVVAVPGPTAACATAFTCWYDRRSSPLGDLYWRSVDCLGAMTPGQSAAFCDTAGLQGEQALATVQLPTASPQLAYGVVGIWRNASVGLATDIVAGRVGSTELAPAWPTQGIVVCDAPGQQTSPAVVPTGIDAGGSVLGWIDQRDGASQIYAQRLSVDGQPQWAANGVLVGPELVFRASLQMATAGDGGAYLAWYDYRFAVPGISLARIGPNGTVAAGWPVGGRRVGPESHVRFLVKLLPRPEGGVFVVWDDHGPTDVHPRALAIDADGQPVAGWPDEGVVLSSTGGGAMDAAPTADGIVVAFGRDVDPDPKVEVSDLFAQRLLADGSIAPGWPADGAPVCTAAGSQSMARVIASGNGAIFAWADDRAPTAPDLYALRLLENGTTDPNWPANGLVVRAELGRESMPSLVATSDGAIIAWVSEPGYDSNQANIWAQFVSAGGRLDVVPGSGRAGPGLEPPRPNPAMASVRLALPSARAPHVRIDVLDAAGRRVRAGLERLRSGNDVVWDLTDAHGARVRPGLYFVRARDGEWTATQPVTVVH